MYLELGAREGRGRRNTRLAVHRLLAVCATYVPYVDRRRRSLHALTTASQPKYSDGSTYVQESAVAANRARPLARSLVAITVCDVLRDKKAASSQWDMNQKLLYICRASFYTIGTPT